MDSPEQFIWDPIAYLEGLHTRKILKLRDDCYRFGYDEVDVSDNHQGMTVTANHIRQVLAIREHIPNKTEAKKIRQEKAKAKRHR